MEEVHGVDVSWLHHPSKALHRRGPSVQGNTDKRKDVKPATAPTKPAIDTSAKSNGHPAAPTVTPPTPVHEAKERVPVNSTTPNQISKTPQKRPGLPKTNSDDGRSPGSRRASWMNSISSKFSSSTPEKSAATTSPQSVTANGAPVQPAEASPEACESAEPYTPSKSKDSSFFSSITRRLSSSSQNSTPSKPSRGGTVCARCVLNVDPNRERCALPEMESSRLRRVSFCVDVEVAGGPRYGNDNDDDSDTERIRKKKEFKLKERAEGEALKRPEALKEEKDEHGAPKIEQKAAALPVAQPGAKAGAEQARSPPKTEIDDEAAQRRREKKKRSEEERKERKEKRRRRAEENGQIPVELSLDDADDSSASSVPEHQPPAPAKAQHYIPLPGQIPLPPALMPAQQTSEVKGNRQARPTTDPVRIYRRCCQLRESPILKRITEQLTSPTCCLPQDPGVVNCLDLTGSRLQTADVATLGDWLAVVPVKKLIFEDADLNDEGVRCVLAGLLAAKKPELSGRKTGGPKHRQAMPHHTYQERAGVVEKLSFKNNPRISRQGWKHIGLFIYSCRSIKAIDLSMNQFPETLPSGLKSAPTKSNPSAPVPKVNDLDAAEIMFKCISKRRAGSKLEELILSECGLSAAQLRRIIDGVMISGISRLGIAGNQLDDEGLGYVMAYLASGVCSGLDIGGNDLRGKLDVVAQALHGSKSQLGVMSDRGCWGLSLAGCNLDSASLKPLFPALSHLSNFRFIDLSHNRDLFADNDTVSLLRRYIGQMKTLKRIHLCDCGISPKQAIALADALPDGPMLAHLNLLQNPQLTALAEAKTEEQQEEACALYASLMAAVRVSSSLICIDIDVPSPDNSEVVKALAKQVVAYALRNMEQFAIAEATGDENAIPTANATSALTSAYGGEKGVRETNVPDVLMHLVGHVDGVPENHDDDDPAPDDDYIVGGTGVVKALQYVLGEKANDRRGSLNSPIPSSAASPQRPSSAAGTAEEQRGKAKKMSTNLLGSARKIRARLQPALVKEASANNELAYRRLLFLDQTLQSMIQRFEEEYPETREALSTKEEARVSTDETRASNENGSRSTTPTEEPVGHGVDTDEDELPEVDEAFARRGSRRGSDVSIASRRQTIEEGRLHRLGQRLRREMMDSPRSTVAEGSSLPPWQRDGQDESDTKSPPAADEGKAAAAEHERLVSVGARIEALTGPELKSLYDKDTVENVLASFGGSYEDLRRLQEQDPEAWAQFTEAQIKARLNLKQHTMDAPSAVVGE